MITTNMCIYVHRLGYGSYFFYRCIRTDSYLNKVKIFETRKNNKLFILKITIK